MVGGDDSKKKNNINIIITSVKFDYHTRNDLYTVHFKYDKHKNMNGIAESITENTIERDHERNAVAPVLTRKVKEQHYKIHFKFSELKTMYELVDTKCKEKTTEDARYKSGTKGANKTDIMGHCDVTRSMELRHESNTIKFDMKSSINIQKGKGVDVFMKIENFGSAHPAMVSLHYSTDSSDEDIKKLDDDKFYKHFIEDADKNYNFSANAIKFIIALYVDSIQGKESKMKNPSGGTKRGGSTRKLK